MFYIFLLDQDGGYVDEREYDTADELLRDWPHAQYQGDGCYEDWIGGYRI
jgi:hypothetical protein